MRNLLPGICVFFLLLAGACETPCGEIECANDPILFTIFRSDGQNLLQDPNSTLNPASVQFYYFENGSRIDLEVSQQQNNDGQTIALQTFLSNEEVSRYFFSTNISTADTLAFTFAADPEGCCPSKSIEGIYQDGQKIVRENSGYTFTIPAPSEE